MLNRLYLSAAMCVSTVAPVTAAEILWQAPQNTYSKQQLIGGDIVFAVNGGGEVTVEDAGPDGTGSYFFHERSYGTINFAPEAQEKTHTIAAGSKTTGDADFDAVLNTFTWAPQQPSSGVQTFRNLEPGAVYQIQYFYNDPRADRIMQFSSAARDAVAGLSSKGSGWGQNVVGTFVADGTTQDVVHTALGFPSVHFTAYILSKVDGNVVWSEAKDTTGKSQIIGGQHILSVNGGNTNETVFRAGEDALQTPTFARTTHSRLNMSPALASQPFRVSSPDTGDADFDDVLEQLSYVTTGEDTVIHTVDGLIPGRQYQYQFFFYDPRPCCAIRTMILSDTDNLDQSVAVAASASDAGFGQHVVGTFVATGTTKSIQHNAGGYKNVHFNAIVVSEVSAGNEAKIFGDQFTTSRQFKVFPTFANAVSDFTANDLTVTGGSVVSLSGEGRFYTAVIEATGAADVTVEIAASSENAASNTLVVENRAFTGEAWVIESQEDWTDARLNDNGMTVEDGVLVPTADVATYNVISQSFGQKMQPSSLILEQLPVWNNWTGVANIGPSNVKDAPVLLPVEDGSYYFLALNGNEQVYSAWHSTDMTNWTLRGPVSPKGDGRWVTSAEMKDGKFYIYADVPNDQNPTVFIDDNLDDGVPGTAGGTALVKPHCGSDAAFFRSDSDGLFHVVYENWTPINARDHSWDSPLAGHASSADGVNGFVANEHRPAVDVRTAPTGETASYAHPQIGTCTYDVHEDGQDAFGDWTAIKIGDQHYLFGDYDKHGEGIKVGWFTSDSIYEQFDFVGEIGDGHPDPTIGFAEGQFYLITQQTTDYVSPGPWVDGVSVRVAVDTTNDGVFDYWSPNTPISELYDHKPGFARVVERTPAALDLSDMPPGYKFRVKIFVNDRTVPNATPLVNRLEMQFE